MAGLTNPMPAPTPAVGAPPPPAPVPAGAPPAQGAPPPAQPGAQPPQKPAGPPIGDGPVDPELLKRMEANCMNVVTATLPAISKLVSQAQDKPGVLAQAAVQVVIRVEDSMEQNKIPLNLSMTFQAGAETLSDIADAMEKAGVYTYSQQEIDGAFLRAVDLYRVARVSQGRINQAMFQQKLAQLKQQEQNGTLDQQYPGITQFAQKAQKQAAPAGKPDMTGDQSVDGETPDPNAPPQNDGLDSTDTDNDGGDMPPAGGKFPAHMLRGKSGPKKPPKNAIAVSAHYRMPPMGKKAPKKPKPKVKAKPKTPNEGAY